MIVLPYWCSFCCNITTPIKSKLAYLEQSILKRPPEYAYLFTQPLFWLCQFIDSFLFFLICVRGLDTKWMQKSYMCSYNHLFFFYTVLNSMFLFTRYIFFSRAHSTPWITYISHIYGVKYLGAKFSMQIKSVTIVQKKL